MFLWFSCKKMWALQNFPCPLIHVIDLSSWKEYCRENSKDAKVPRHSCAHEIQQRNVREERGCLPFPIPLFLLHVCMYL